MEGKKMKEFSVPMALVDFIPVLLFAVAAIMLQRDLYNKMSKGAFALFATGTIDIIFAGFLKALGKANIAYDEAHMIWIDTDDMMDFEVIKDKHGLVIGCMARMKYQNYELQFEKGSKLFLYTDGVPEATDPDGKMFGMERMVEALNKNPQDPPKLLLEHFRDHVNEFVNGAEQFDDMTMLCFEYKGVKE